MVPLEVEKNPDHSDKSRVKRDGEKKGTLDKGRLIIVDN